ncbi:MAG: alpha/beta hydrolase [Bacteroidetes bacterium]|nr:MAG: alpha/beta hydrolase [Bacteroidota bacterium]
MYKKVDHYLVLLVVLLFAACQTPRKVHVSGNAHGHYHGTYRGQKVQFAVYPEEREIYMYEEKHTRPALNQFKYTPDDVALARDKREDADTTVEVLVRGFLRRQRLEAFSTEYIDTQQRYSEYAFDSVEVVRDIPYGEALGYWSSKPIDDKPDYMEVIRFALANTLKPENLQLSFDLYQPYGDTLSRRPVLVWLHGGAFLMGDKNTTTIELMAHELARRGYVVVAPSYRLGFRLAPNINRVIDRGNRILGREWIPQPPNPVERTMHRSFQDARAALRYVVHHYESLGIDTSAVFIGGTSAGAMVALGATFMTEESRFRSSIGKDLRSDFLNWQAGDQGCLDCSTNNLNVSFRIKGVINCWGAVTDDNIIDNKPHIPVLSFHGTADDIVPAGYGYPFNDIRYGINRIFLDKVYGSVPIHQRLQNPHSRLVLFPDAPHDLHQDESGFNSFADTLLSATAQFLHRRIQPQFDLEQREVFYQNQLVFETFTLSPPRGYAYSFQPEGGFVSGQGQNTVTIVWYREGSLRVAATMPNKARTVKVLPAVFLAEPVH